MSSSSLRPLPPARGRGALARIACAPCREARSARCRLAAAAALGRGLVAAAILHQILHTQQATGFPSAPSASSLELLNPSWDATPEFDGEVLRAERSRLGHACAPFVVASRSCDMHFRGARSYTAPNYAFNRTESHRISSDLGNRPGTALGVRAYRTVL